MSSLFPTSRVAVLLAIALIASMQGPRCRSVAEEPTIKPIRALLVLGGCCHDYDTQKELLSEGLAERAHVEVIIAHDPDTTTEHLNPVYESPAWAQGFDVVIHDECSSHITDVSLIDRILEPHRRGLPAVILHCGMHSYRSAGYPDVTPWFEFTGLQSTGHGPQVPIDITFSSPAGAITEGLTDWTTIDEELYNNSSGNLLGTATPLARGKQTLKSKSGVERQEECVVVWTNDYRNTAKVFATTLGHNNETVADSRYLDLITRGLLWSCGKLNRQYLKPR